jgi:hypothetical protein
LLRKCRESMSMDKKNSDDEKGLPQSPTVRLMYMEVISKSEYERYSRDHSHRAQPHIPSTALAMMDMDDDMRTRHQIGYVSENLKSWASAFETSGLELPKPGEKSPNPTVLRYGHDGVKWRSDWRVIVEYDTSAKGDPIVEHRLVIHLPNDGFFYVEESVESVLKIKKTAIVNDRHEQRNGWALVDPEAWGELAPFEEFARQWFGYTDGEKLRRMILYNATSNRLDICLQCAKNPKKLNGIEFSLEPGFPLTPIPENFWD